MCSNTSMSLRCVSMLREGFVTDGTVCNVGTVRFNWNDLALIAQSTGWSSITSAHGCSSLPAIPIVIGLNRLLPRMFYVPETLVPYRKQTIYDQIPHSTSISRARTRADEVRLHVLFCRAVARIRHRPALEARPGQTKRRRRGCVSEEPHKLDHGTGSADHLPPEAQVRGPIAVLYRTAAIRAARLHCPDEKGRQISTPASSRSRTTTRIRSWSNQVGARRTDTSTTTKPRTRER